MKLAKAAKLPLWAIFRMVSRFNLLRKYRYIFILGHMRSGSSLLAHILVNHPDIAGAGESHISYRTEADLDKLILQICEFLRRPLVLESHIVDQINHEYVPNEILLSKKVYKCIILLRESEATLKSMMNLTNNGVTTWDEQHALELYISRLKSLTQYGLLLGKQALLVEYDDLIDRTNETLSAITGFLGLDTPLSPNYANHRMTAVFGYGDPSNNIKIGQIVRTPNHNLTLSEDTLSAAASAFRKCREQLQGTTTPAVSRSIICEERTSMRA